MKYIIDDELLEICEGAMSDGWFNAVRKHPLSEHDAEIRMKEREWVLKIIHNKMKERYAILEDAGRKQQYAIMISFIKSLRGEP